MSFIHIMYSCTSLWWGSQFCKKGAKVCLKGMHLLSQVILSIEFNWGAIWPFALKQARAMRSSQQHHSAVLPEGNSRNPNSLSVNSTDTAQRCHRVIVTSICERCWLLWSQRCTELKERLWGKSEVLTDWGGSIQTRVSTWKCLRSSSWALGHVGSPRRWRWMQKSLEGNVWWLWATRAHLWKEKSQTRWI